MVKFEDKTGDKVTLTCKNDLHTALGELVQQYQRAAQASHGPRLNNFPPLRLHVVPVASAADVPRPPPEEEFERQMAAMQRSQQQQQAAAQVAALQAAAAEAKKVRYGPRYGAAVYDAAVLRAQAVHGGTCMHCFVC